jgi:hypothetical protein
MSINLKRYLSYILGNIIINLICGLIVYKATKNPPFDFIQIITDYKIWILLIIAGVSGIIIVRLEGELNNKLEAIKLESISRQKGYDVFAGKVSDLLQREEFDKLEKLLITGEHLDSYYGKSR